LTVDKLATEYEKSDAYQKSEKKYIAKALVDTNLYILFKNGVPTKISHNKKIIGKCELNPKINDRYKIFNIYYQAEMFKNFVNFAQDFILGINYKYSNTTSYIIYDFNLNTIADFTNYNEW